MKIKVVEMHKRTIQGEGPYIGSVMSLVRFGGCNLACHYCDTVYEGREKVVALEDFAFLPDVMVTGGEPTAIKYFLPLMKYLTKKGFRPHVETNGLNLPLRYAKQFPTTMWTISPKLKSSGNSIKWSRYGPRLALFLEKAMSETVLKFVISESVQADLSEISGLMLQYGWVSPVYLQPVDNRPAVYQEMVQRGSDDYLYTMQVHKAMGVV